MKNRLGGFFGTLGTLRNCGEGAGHLSGIQSQNGRILPCEAKEKEGSRETSDIVLLNRVKVALHHAQFSCQIRDGPTLGLARRAKHFTD